MMERDWDSLIRSALLEAARARWEGLTEEGPELHWTPRRQKVMDRLLQDPVAYARKLTASADGCSGTKGDDVS